jgi:hypothetical protein
MADVPVSSRYYGQKLDVLSLTEDGEPKLVVFYQFDDPTGVPYSVHTYVVGERLDQLSYRYYRRPDLWWVIAEYNPQIKDIYNIPAGTELRIPNV